MESQFKSIITLEDYPNASIKINLSLLFFEGSVLIKLPQVNILIFYKILSTLFNSTMITLLLNGVNLKKVCYSYDIAINSLKEISRLIYFPNNSEEKVNYFLLTLSFYIACFHFGESLLWYKRKCIDSNQFLRIGKGKHP